MLVYSTCYGIVLTNPLYAYECASVGSYSAPDMDIFWYDFTYTSCHDGKQYTANADIYGYAKTADAAVGTPIAVGPTGTVENWTPCEIVKPWGCWYQCSSFLRECKSQTSCKDPNCKAGHNLKKKK